MPSASGGRVGAAALSGGTHHLAEGCHMADVLIIDDDTAAAEALAVLLRREGHKAACACAAKDALAHLHQHEPDLVRLDLEMPRVDGLDLLDALRDEVRFADLRVAIFSGRDDPAAVEAAGRLGACEFIHKGGDWNETFGRIKAALAAVDADASPA